MSPNPANKNHAASGRPSLGRLTGLGLGAVVVAGLAWWIVRPPSRAGQEPPHLREVARLEQSRNITALSARARDPDESIAVRAVQGLGAVGGQEAARELAPVFADSRPQVRAMAALQYASTGAADVAPLAAALGTDASVDVRAAAAEAIGRMRSFDGVDALLKGLMDPDTEVRRASITAIEQVFPGVKFNYDPNAPDSQRYAAAGYIRQQYPKWKTNYDMTMRRTQQQRTP